MRRFLLALWVVGLGLLLLSCGSEAELDTSLGGSTTRDSTNRNAFSLPAPALSNEERRVFEIGDSFFTQNWVAAPASTDARDGLGPLFNAQACSSCHLLDGRGLPPDPLGEDVNLGLLFRLSVAGEDENGGPQPHPVYGGQLQDRAILGVEAEGTMGITYDPVIVVLDDGTEVELRAPHYFIAEPTRGEPGDELLIGPRLAPQVIGMGLLESIPEETILALADPDDSDDDGISGRPNWVWSERQESVVLGRFGWKANVATVEEQVAGAFSGDIGITSSLHPAENCGTVAACLAAPNGGAPEITDSRLVSVTFYQQVLSVPALRNPEDQEVQDGSAVFDDLGCESCHVRQVSTGPADIATLAEQDIQPFTDLLLHDMGGGLADGRPDFEATGVEWRTPPLWGLGLIEEVNGQRFLLHDGRARTLEEAILWHGGEAQESRDGYAASDAADRTALIKFLEAL